MADRRLLPLLPALRPAPQSGIGNCLIGGRARPRAPALHGLWQAPFAGGGGRPLGQQDFGRPFLAEGAASLLLRSLQGRGEPQKEPGTYAQNEEENGGLLLRFALWENLILQDF